jgi:hypothetical protein
VTIYRHDAERLLKLRDIRCIERCPGLYVQASDMLYDAKLGLVTHEGAPGDPAATNNDVPCFLKAAIARWRLRGRTAGTSGDKRP